MSVGQLLSSSPASVSVCLWFWVLKGDWEAVEGASGINKVENHYIDAEHVPYILTVFDYPNISLEWNMTQSFGI